MPFQIFKNRFILKLIFSKWIILSFFLSGNQVLIAQYSGNKNEIFSFERMKSNSISLEHEISFHFLKKIEIKPSYSISSFNWSIAGNQNMPNVLSEVTWRNLLSYGVQTNVSMQFNNAIRPFISWVKEKNYHGIAADVDYSEDNRNGTSYYKEFDSNTGYYSRLSLLQPITKNNNLLLGFSSSFQKLNLFHDNIGNSSYYKAFWYGLEGKFSYSIFNKKQFSILTDSNIRLSRYFAKANWILREELKHPDSFKHYTFKGELQSSIQMILKLYNNINIGGGSEFTFQKSLKGVDQLFFSNGTFALTQLNGINGNRLSFFLLININF